MNEEITTALEKFIKGGDTSDTALLGEILHDKFQNLQHGFFEEKGVFSISKNEYIELISTGKFGGKPRKLQILNLDIMENMAMAKVSLESAALKFISYISLVLDTDNAWKVVGNFPKIETKFGK